MADDADIKCPDCGSTKLERYGRTKAGKRKFRCLNPGRAPDDTRPGPCRRQFVWPQDREISKETRDKIEALLASRTKVAVIHKVFPDVSIRSIYKLGKKADAPHD